MNSVNQTTSNDASRIALLSSAGALAGGAIGAKTAPSILKGTADEFINRAVNSAIDCSSHRWCYDNSLNIDDATFVKKVCSKLGKTGYDVKNNLTSLYYDIVKNKTEILSGILGDREQIVESASDDIRTIFKNAPKQTFKYAGIAAGIGLAIGTITASVINLVKSHQQKQD